MNIILLGAPGSGKGTQAVIIKEKYNLAHISTGEILRQHIKDETELGKQAKECVEKGQLVSDELVIKMVRARLGEDDCKNGFILDGFPRNESQAKALDVCLSEMNLKIDYALYFDCPEEILLQRLGGRRVCNACGATFHVTNMPSKVEGICDACGAELITRKDDQPETIKNRLDVYNETAAPLLGYYKNAGNLFNLPAEKSADEVDQILSKEFQK